jgi:hypothetical protein
MFYTNPYNRILKLCFFSSPHLIDRYLGKISTTSQEHIRQGFALALASLPSEMLLTNNMINKILDCLFSLIIITNQTQHLIKQRKDTLIALCNLYENIHMHHLSPFFNEDLIKKLINSFIRCTRDYTNDRFGDSGRLVRETACTQLVRLLKLINSNSQTKHLLTSSILHNCLNSILTNLCSKIDDLRLISGKSLIEFLNIEFEQPIEHKNELKQIFSDENLIDWRNSQIVFSLIVQLLIYDKYRYIIWLNCLITAGELSNASQSLYSFLILHKTNNYLINLLLNDLEKIFSEKQSLQIRIIIPCIQALERLLSQSTFENYYEENSEEFILYWIKLLHLFEDILIKKLQILNNNPTLYIHFIKLYCSLLQFNNIQLRNLILKLITKFFLHNYPWVRRQAAQNLYDTCIMFNDDLFSDDNQDISEQVLNVLTETDWEKNLDELTNIRQTLLNLFHIE